MNSTQENKSTKDWYVASFEGFEKKLNGHSETILHEVRKKALSKLVEMNFPTTREEEWKYTNVSPILKHNFVPALNTGPAKLSKEEISKYLFGGFDSYIAVFVNGIFSEELSSLAGLPAGILIGSLKNISGSNPELIEEYLNDYHKFDNAFNALNAAYSIDGLVIIVRDGKVVDKPVQVLYLNGGSDAVLSTPRNIIVAGKNSQLSIISNYYGFMPGVYFTNVVSDLYAGEHAVVDYYKIQNENDEAFHIEKFQGRQEKGSVLNHFNFTFGGAIVRNDINTVLEGENIETHYYGFYLANGKRHVDNHTFVDHAKPHCVSNELYKGILDDNARGVFNGKIIVRRNAQKTNAYQQNKTILLSKGATIDTKPQLEIFADDVKCTHGATVGHLDDTANFYIRTRGIPDELAKSMLIRAFANDIVEMVKIDPMREELNHMVFENLHRIEISNQL